MPEPTAADCLLDADAAARAFIEVPGLDAARHLQARLQAYFTAVEPPAPAPPLPPELEATRTAATHFLDLCADPDPDSDTWRRDIDDVRAALRESLTKAKPRPMPPALEDFPAPRAEWREVYAHIQVLLPYLYEPLHRDQPEAHTIRAGQALRLRDILNRLAPTLRRITGATGVELNDQPTPVALTNARNAAMQFLSATDEPSDGISTNFDPVQDAVQHLQTCIDGLTESIAPSPHGDTRRSHELNRYAHELDERDITAALDDAHFMTTEDQPFRERVLKAIQAMSAAVGRATSLQMQLENGAAQPDAALRARLRELAEVEPRHHEHCERTCHSDCTYDEDNALQYLARQLNAVPVDADDPMNPEEARKLANELLQEVVGGSEGDLSSWLHVVTTVRQLLKLHVDYRQLTVLILRTLLVLERRSALEGHVDAKAIRQLNRELLHAVEHRGVPNPVINAVCT